MEIITSAENKRVKLYESLKMKKYRDKNGLFIVEEVHMIEEAIKARLLDTLIIRGETDDIFDFSNTLRVSDPIMKKLSDNVSLNDYIGICRLKENRINFNGSTIVILDDVQDPGNVGTIIRTAYSFGYRNIVLTKGCADLYNEKTIKATQGALFHLNVIRSERHKIVEKCCQENYKIISTALEDSIPLSQAEKPERFALVFGNEGKGISQFIKDNSDQLVRIEMDSFDSLNVAVAAGICLYKYR